MLTIEPHRRAAYPALAIETHEDARFCESLLTQYPEREMFSVAAAGGLRDLRTGKVLNEAAKYGDALKHASSKDRCFLIVLDFQHVAANAPAYRQLIDALPALKRRASMVLLLAPSWNLPAELQHQLPVLRDSLPTAEELASTLDVVLEAMSDASDKAKADAAGVTPEKRNALLQSARGLTRDEAENAFALAAADGLQVHAVEAEKLRLVKSRCMSVEKPGDPAQLGGLGGFKRWIASDVLPAKDDPELRARGTLLLGIPGTGKSLTSRIVAAMLQWPLVCLDISAAKGSLLGESEANLRHALATVEAIAPCVLWIDEIEKAVGGYQSSGATDGGTTLAMVGTLLKWMQEHTSPVFIVATCNDFEKLPAPLTRAGRFDERFFVDLPTASERSQIARIHLTKMHCEIDGLPAIVSGITSDWTGAEIEQLIKSAARQTRRQITEQAVRDAARDIIPLSKTTNVQGLRDWAKDHMRPANDPEPATAATNAARRIS